MTFLDELKQALSTGQEEEVKGAIQRQLERSAVEVRDSVLMEYVRMVVQVGNDIDEHFLKEIDAIVEELRKIDEVEANLRKELEIKKLKLQIDDV